MNIPKVNGRDAKAGRPDFKVAGFSHDPRDKTLVGARKLKRSLVRGGTTTFWQAGVVMLAVCSLAAKDP
jgi:hypothetical protein